jgi:hypothetical protein
MKVLLPLALLALLSASVTAQISGGGSGLGSNGGVIRTQDIGNSPNTPVTNPEPMTLAALAGGAAIAGSLLRRRKQRKQK